VQHFYSFVFLTKDFQVFPERNHAGKNRRGDRTDVRHQPAHGSKTRRKYFYQLGVETRTAAMLRAFEVL
jgi:hypothetical protein